MYIYYLAILCGHCLLVTVTADYGSQDEMYEKQKSSKKIAVIGGGVTGSFVTKYLVDLDIACSKVESITIFDPNPVVGPESSTNAQSDAFVQGSRVRSYRLKDGATVELGASIGYKGFYHVIEMINNDDTIEMTEPFDIGIPLNDTDDNGGEIRDGFGVYDGKQKWPLITAGVTESQMRMNLALRYNWDLYKVTNKCRSFLNNWATLPSLLNDPDVVFDSPDAIWDRLGLKDAVHSSFDSLLNSIGVSSDNSWLKKILPYQGSLRSELLTAVNLVNYNQNNADVNGVVGMGSFAASLGGLFSVKGGNFQIIQSAFRQATKKRQEMCDTKSSDHTIRHSDVVVTTVIGSLDGFTLYSGKEMIGSFDIVVLAAPIQHSKITFLSESHFDPAVIQPMPLGGLVDAHNERVHAGGGREVLPSPLPPIMKRPYKQVITTIISNATWTTNTLSYPTTAAALPKSIMMTNDGKYDFYNITAITCIRKGLFKLFSDNPISENVRKELFGPYHTVEIEKKWGGPTGGATPDYRGQGVSTPFLLYDGAAGLQGHTTSGALYYPVAMEQSSLASMEIAAVGSKAVAKLIARRLGIWKEQDKRATLHEELR